MKNENELLHLFIGGGNTQIADKLKEPFLSHGRVYGTNGHVAVIIDKELCEGEYEEKNRAIEMPPFKGTNLLTRAQLKAFLDNSPMEPEMKMAGEDVECPICNGVGEVEWQYTTWKPHYEHWEQMMECPSCHGSGYESEAGLEPTGAMIYDKNYAGTFVLLNPKRDTPIEDELQKGEKKVRAFYLLSAANMYRVYQAMELMELDTVEVMRGSIPSMMRVRLMDGVDVAVMELLSRDGNAKVLMEPIEHEEE
jgi:hypothetical protein